MKYSASLIAGLLCLCLTTTGFAQIIYPEGITKSYYSAYTLTSSGIEIDINGTLVNTGTIVYNLDTAFPRTANFLELNWDTMTSRTKLNLVAAFPEIDPAYSGLTATYSLVANGTFTITPSDSLSLMAGTEMHFKEHKGGEGDFRPRYNGSPLMRIKTIDEIINEGSLRIQDKQPIWRIQGSAHVTNYGGQVSGGGDIGVLVAVPEPSTYGIIAVLGLIGLVAARRFLAIKRASLPAP